MVIIFQVYENYNSEVTRHVDLPTNEGIKNTSSHLPENLFADNNLVRSGDSPIQIYQELQGQQPPSFPINNRSLINQVWEVINLLNKDRRHLDNIIDNEDLNTFSNIQAIYEDIEKAEDLFDQTRTSVKIFEKLILEHYHNVDLPEKEKQVYTAFIEVHFDIKKIVRQLWAENQSEIFNSVSKLEKEIEWTKRCILELSSVSQQNELLSTLTTIDKILVNVKDYTRGISGPQAYEPFGRGYYYHNYELLPKINQYGSGYTWKLEEFFRKYNWEVIHFLEEPHYLKIIYPERIPLEMLKNKSLDPGLRLSQISPPELPVIEKIVVEKSEEFTTIPNAVVEIPEEEEPDLDYTISYNERIRIDSSHVDLILMDHLRKDGDRVSINVNGEWTHRQISLERNPQIIELSINPSVINTIIIRADNEGWMPPNTIGIRYSNKDGSTDHFIRRDLTYSEAIEIKVTN